MEGLVCGGRSSYRYIYHILYLFIYEYLMLHGGWIHQWFLVHPNSLCRGGMI
jgi:uncharacterized membrane protein